MAWGARSTPTGTSTRAYGSTASLKGLAGPSLTVLRKHPSSRATGNAGPHVFEMLCCALLRCGVPKCVVHCMSCRYIWVDFNEYDGEWRSGRLHGQGTFVWKTGERYDGEWKVSNAVSPHFATLSTMHLFELIVVLNINACLTNVTHAPSAVRYAYDLHCPSRRSDSRQINSRSQCGCSSSSHLLTVSD